MAGVVSNADWQVHANARKASARRCEGGVAMVAACVGHDGCGGGGTDRGTVADDAVDAERAGLKLQREMGCGP